MCRKEEDDAGATSEESDKPADDEDWDRKIGDENEKLDSPTVNDHNGLVGELLKYRNEADKTDMSVDEQIGGEFDGAQRKTTIETQNKVSREGKGGNSVEVIQGRGRKGMELEQLLMLDTNLRGAQNSSSKDDNYDILEAEWLEVQHRKGKQKATDTYFITRENQKGENSLSDMNIGKPNQAGRNSQMQTRGNIITEQRNHSPQIITFYFSNFPEAATLEDLKYVFGKIAKVVDLYIPPKRPKYDQKFGFVRYATNDIDRGAIEKLGDLWMARHKLFVTKSKFEKTKPTHERNSTQWNSQTRIIQQGYKTGNGIQFNSKMAGNKQMRWHAKPPQGRSYLDALNEGEKQIQHQSILLDDECFCKEWLNYAVKIKASSPKHIPEIIDEMKTKLGENATTSMIGELWILCLSKSEAKLDNVIYCCNMLKQRGIISEFERWKQHSNPETRTVWLQITNVPLYNWCQRTFSLIAKEWGEVQEIDKDTLQRHVLTYGRVLIKTKVKNQIEANRSLEGRGLIYVIQIREEVNNAGDILKFAGKDAFQPRSTMILTSAVDDDQCSCVLDNVEAAVYADQNNLQKLVDRERVEDTLTKSFEEECTSKCSNMGGGKTSSIEDKSQQVDPWARLESIEKKKRGRPQISVGTNLDYSMVVEVNSVSGNLATRGIEQTNAQPIHATHEVADTGFKIQSATQLERTKKKKRGRPRKNSKKLSSIRGVREFKKTQLWAPTDLRMGEEDRAEFLMTLGIDNKLINGV